MFIISRHCIVKDREPPTCKKYFSVSEVVDHPLKPMTVTVFTHEVKNSFFILSAHACCRSLKAGMFENSEVLANPAVQLRQLFLCWNHWVQHWMVVIL